VVASTTGAKGVHFVPAGRKVAAAYDVTALQIELATAPFAGTTGADNQRKEFVAPSFVVGCFRLLRLRFLGAAFHRPGNTLPGNGSVIRHHLLGSQGLSLDRGRAGEGFGSLLERRLFHKEIPADAGRKGITNSINAGSLGLYMARFLDFYVFRLAFPIDVDVNSVVAYLHPPKISVELFHVEPVIDYQFIEF
jgi:hypothetical protein